MPTFSRLWAFLFGETYMKLTGPQEVNLAFIANDVQYTVENGEVTPDILPADVPDNLFALGFSFSQVVEKPAIAPAVASPAKAVQADQPTTTTETASQGE